MKTGDKIQIISQLGRKVETISLLRIEGASVFADITPESSGGALKQAVKLDLIPPFIESGIGNSEFRYRGEIRGAVLVPDMFWKCHEQENHEAALQNKPISFPLPNEIQKLIRNLPIRTKNLAEEYTEFLKKVGAKVGTKRATDVEVIFGPILREIIKSMPDDASLLYAFFEEFRWI